MTLEADRAANQVTDDAPNTLADEFIERYAKNDGEISIRYWRGDWYIWKDGRFKLEHVEQLSSHLWMFLSSLKVRDNKSKWRKYRVDASRVRHVVAAMQAKCQAFVDEMPAWLDTNRPRATDIIAFTNGLLDVTKCRDGTIPILNPPSPLWFSRTVLPYKFNPRAECKQWLKFLADVFDDDTECVALLQEWFGYCLTSDTAQHKMMMLIGPPRSGKSTIARVLVATIGRENTTSPTISQLGERFGLASLLGKSVAICGDAHVSHGGGSDTIKILETLKTITGEDSCVIDRKNKDALTSVRLITRFIILANELPQLSDASAALVPRLLLLQMNKSYAGREDKTLEARLTGEVPGIMRWALDGLKRLTTIGTFTVPESVREEVNEFERLSSPIKAFVQDCLDMVVEATETSEMMYVAYRQYCTQTGRKPLAIGSFGAKLHAAIPGLRKSRPRNTGGRSYVYEGIQLKQGWVLTPSFTGDN